MSNTTENPDAALRNAVSSHPQAMVRYRQMQAVIQASIELIREMPKGFFTDMEKALREGKWLP